MVRRPNRGLTLVEVLVLVVILGLVLMMIVSSLPRRHNPARRATCMNNMKELSLAALQCESSHLTFPGYKNTVARDSSGRAVLDSAWVVPQFSGLERVDLYRRWRDNSPESVFVRVMICPSDPPESTAAGSAPLGYVANCGNATPNPACGVFFDASDSAETKVSMSLDYLSQHDGSSNTLMLSENVNVGDARRWDFKDAEVTIDRVGFRWDRGGINEEIAEDRPRPSSFHPGGVNVSFCDGHTYFLSEDISENVLQHLCTPDSASAGVPGELEETDY